MDNLEKDKYIKEKLQQDKQISDKANLMFEKMMSANFDELEEKVTDTEEKKTERKVIPFRKRFASIAASVLILFLGVNAYAYSQGWDNIFFKINEIFKGVQETEKDNLLSDRDLMISYSDIEVIDGLNIEINKITTEESKTTLYVRLKTTKTAKETEELPLMFEVLDEDGVTLAKQQSQMKGESVEAEEAIVINEKVDIELDILTLNIYSKSDELLKTINIDLLNKTLVQVLGEKDIEKLSEIDLKEKLGYFAGIVFEDEGRTTSESTKQVMLAIEILNSDSSGEECITLNKETGMYEYKKDAIDKFGEAIFGINYLYGKDLDTDYMKLNTENNAYYYAEAGDSIFGGFCLSISDISMTEGVYNVKYIATHGVEEMTEELYNSLDKYIIDTQIILNGEELAPYSKYQIVDIKISEIIPGVEEKEDITDEKEEEIFDNTADEEVVLDNKNTITNFGITLQYNEDWEYNYTKIGKKVTIKSPAIGDEEDRVKITFEREENENLGYTTYEMGTDMINDAEKLENFTIIHRGNVRISEYDAYQITISSNDGTNIRKRIFKIILDEYIYTITVEASEYKYGDFYPDVMEIINTMKIENE